MKFHLLFIKWKNLSVKIGMEISLMKNVRDTKSLKHVFLVRLCGLSSLWVYVNVDFMCKNNEWFYWPALWFNLCHTFDTWFMHRCLNYFSHWIILSKWFCWAFLMVNLHLSQWEFGSHFYCDVSGIMGIVMEFPSL